MVKRKLSLYLSPVAHPPPSRSLFRFPLHEDEEYHYSSMDGMQILCKVTPSNCFPGNLLVPIYTPVWRGAL